MQTKRTEWESHISAWQSGGLSQRVYCDGHGLSLSSFGYWRRKLSDEAVKPNGDQPGVMPIGVKPGALVEGVTISLPNGIVLRVPGLGDAMLGGLLRALAAC
jgi:hypothetical protein